MNSIHGRTRLTRAAALAVLTVALTTVAAAPASADPLDDLLATIDTGSSGSSIPGPSAPPVGGAQSYSFSIETGAIRFGDFFTTTVTNAHCVTVAGTIGEEPITTDTPLYSYTRSQWTVTRETTPQCTNDNADARINLTSNGRVEAVVARLEGGSGRAYCASAGCNDSRGRIEVS